MQLASVVAGVTQRVLLHGLDTLKTNVQYARGRGLHERVSVRAAVRRLVLARGGLAAFYRGIVPGVLGTVPYSLVYMPSYRAAKRALSSVNGRRVFRRSDNAASPTPLLDARAVHFLAGAFAGLVGSAVRVPVDVLKKNLQVGAYANLAQAMVGIARRRRPYGSAFYAGWSSALLYDIPYNACQFVVLERVQRAADRWWRSPRDAPPSPPHGRGGGALLAKNVATGAITGAITSALTEPLDVVKTRLMTSAADGGGADYRGWCDAVARIAREEGVLALWKGIAPRLAWVTLGSAVWYGTYESLRVVLEQQQRQRQRRDGARDVARRMRASGE